MPVLKIVNRKGQEFQVLYDECDAALVESHRWFVAKAQSEKYYALTHAGRGRLHDRTYSMSRLIMGLPPNMDVDHVDGNGLNNTRANLRVCPHAKNQFNLRRRYSNTSGYKGVSSIQGSTRWRARIMLGQKERHLGTFTSKEEAARAYDAAAKELFGDFARLNFPNKESP